MLCKRQRPLRLKMCGFTRVEDVRAALSLGVDFIGINLARGPRKVSIHRARELRAAVGVLAQAVALFVDAPTHQVLSDCATSGCGVAQLHGNESPEEVAHLARRLPVIKALRISSAADLAQAKVYAEAGASALLLDAYVPGLMGGSGQQWDLRLLADWQAPCPIFLAGGLRPDNVAEAIGACTVDAFDALDVASGVESAAGIKCPKLMAQFVRAVRTAERT